MEVFRKNRAVQKLGLLLHSGRKTRRGSQEQDITEVRLIVDTAHGLIYNQSQTHNTLHHSSLPPPPQGFGHPSLFHATVVIFLEFFAWGLMTSPTINVRPFTTLL